MSSNLQVVRSKKLAGFVAALRFLTLSAPQLQYRLQKRRVVSILTFVVFLVASGLVFGQPEKQVVETVARTIAGHEDWVKDSKICPSKLIGVTEAIDHLTRNECKTGDLLGCLRKCTSGEAGACYWLAYELQQKSVSQSTYEVLFQRACKLGVMSGCTNRAAGILNDASGSKEARTCAAKTFEMVCARDDPWACTMNALHLSRGIGVPQDTKRALKSLEKSCKYGPEDEACIYAGRIRQDIETRSGPKK
jgi:hypothetical protein